MNKLRGKQVVLDVAVIAVPVPAGFAPFDPQIRVAVNVAAAFPGIGVTDEICASGHTETWPGAGDVVCTAAEVTAAHEITFALMNFGGLATTAANLEIAVLWLRA